MKKIILPKWIAYQTYKYGTMSSRTFISNERIHEFVLLEGLASDLWKVISETQEYNKIKKWAKNKGVINELDGFIEQLRDQDLLLDNTSLKTNIATEIKWVHIKKIIQAQFIIMTTTEIKRPLLKQILMV